MWSDWSGEEGREEVSQRAKREEAHEGAMSEALDAIHEEALKLARRDDLPEAVQDGLNLIILLSRHKADVRNQREKEAAEGASG